MVVGRADANLPLFIEQSVSETWCILRIEVCTEWHMMKNHIFEFLPPSLLSFFLAQN